MSFVNWVIDSLGSDEVIDLYFILSDLKELELTDDERTLANCYDAAAGAVGDGDRGGNIPLGKRVE